MNRTIAAGVVGTFLVAGPAFANDWGSEKDAQVCADLSKWGSPECQGEIGKRTKACLADPDMQTDLAAVGYVPGSENDDGKALCKKEATKEIQKQLARASSEKAEVAKAAKEEAEAVQKRELPKPAGRSPAIEKLLTDNFKKLYTEYKFLKLILDDGTEWSIERSPLGIPTSRSIWATIVTKNKDGKCELYGTYWTQQHNGKTFAGTLTDGAAQRKEILCSKVK